MESQSSRGLLNNFKAVFHLSGYLVDLANKFAIDFLPIYFTCFGGKRPKVRQSEQDLIIDTIFHLNKKPTPPAGSEIGPKRASGCGVGKS